ncbi:hypothetical protein ACS0TY_036073 [Phlomoides rotata]
MSVFALVERLAPIIKSEVSLVINCKQEAASLSSKLSRIQVGLQEAERIGVTDKGVKDWLKQLEDVTYEMDDVLDELETANLQVAVQDTSLNWDKVQSLFVFLSSCLCFKQCLSRREITQKMKALSNRIDTILANRGEYSFVPGVNDRAQEFKQEETISLVRKEFKPYGLEDVKNSLVEKLVFEGEGSDKDTQIISIVGLGGVGKSTLAGLAYNHPDVDGLFAPKGWVSVSQAFDVLAIAKAILESFGEKSDDAHNLETLVQRIKKAVNNKRFLLVLDNVWTEDRNKWKNLRECLDGGTGSRILVTTRHESVARMMGTSYVQSLGLLSDSNCGMILNGIALEGRTGEECASLRGMGMEIAKRCNGLPLAATSVGSMLALRYSELEWRAVLQSPLWMDEENTSDLFRLLNLSYTDLSPVLKRCFLSSVIFPKGASISVDEITKIWMAYGYLNVDEVQLKGFQYLNTLANRSFFQRVASEDGDRVSYKMHDIMHDFATHLSGSDEYSFIRDGGLAKELPWNSLGRFRTFCVSGEELRPDMVSHLTNVRVLSVRDCNLQAIPEKVGKLVHLRYLNVSRNPITKLPEAITDLCNLQTLDIGRCKRLSSLPEGIEKLIKLRHLVNTGTFKLVEFPQGLEKLSGLWTLSEYRGSNLGCLRNLNQLQGSLLLYVNNLNEAGNANLCNKKHIKALELYFAEEAGEVEALKPPPNLLTLVIFSSSGNWLSHWIHTSSFDNLKKVCFVGYGQCSAVPPFGKLPSLEVLEIVACSFKLLSNEFLGLDDASRQVVGGFPRLRMLRFVDCSGWEEWEDIKEEEAVPIMKCLEELEMKGCGSLQELPPTLFGKATSLKVVKMWGNSKIRLPPNRTWTVEMGLVDRLLSILPNVINLALPSIASSILENRPPPPPVFNPLPSLRRARRQRPTPDTKVSTSESQ